MYKMTQIFLAHSGTIIVLIVLVIFSFFFSASETSLIGLSKIRLRHMLSRGVKRAQSIQRLIGNMDKLIVAILVGNNFTNIAMSAIVAGIFLDIFGHKWGILLATLCTSAFVLIFLEITPKVLAIKHTEKTALFTAPIMEVFIKIFNPIIMFFRGISNIVLKFLGIASAKKSPLITKEELRLMIEIGKEEGFVTEKEGKMLHRIFEFGDTQVGDVMVPKEKMVATDINTAPEALLNVFVEEGHARLPVYKDSRDNIVGVIYARDLLYILRDKGLFVLSDLVHEPYYVRKTMRVNTLLEKFQSDNIQIAIVIDEHKKAVGLVTLEDLIEEIVGEIEEKQSRRK